ncbi:MAG: hypothetical protein IJX13_04850 [Clostridia bacterium]|nr:hypothetical protein [Clostridia bacterium]
MIQMQNPLEVIAHLKQCSGVDIDANHSNRYCILLNTEYGKEGYFFATPIYNMDTLRLVNRSFAFADECFRAIGSSSTVQVTADQLVLKQQEKSVRLTFQTPKDWILQNGRLVSEDVSLIPTYNGVCIEGRIDQLNFDVWADFSYQNIRSSKNCVCFMQERFKPIFVISALYAGALLQECRPIQVKLTKKNSACESVRFLAEDSDCKRGAVEINFYEPKLIYDTPVSSQHPKENNAFGPVAYIGKSSMYGSQWLYSRLDVDMFRDLHHEHIFEIKLWIPRFTTNMMSVDLFRLANRFCSFGSNWSNKVQTTKMENVVDLKGDYMCIDLTDIYVQRGQLVESAGFVLLPSRMGTTGYQTVSTGDCYSKPPIITIKYAEKKKN